MRKLKTTLSYDSGYYIHLGIVLVLFLLAREHLIALFFLIAEGLYLWVRFRRLFFLGAACSALALISLLLWLNQSVEPDATLLTGRVAQVSKDHFELVTEDGRVFVYPQSEDVILPGDEIEVSGRIYTNTGTAIEHSFSYQAYLRSMGIQATFYANEITVTGHQIHPDIVRYRVREYLLRVFPKDVSAMLLYTLLGDADSMDDSTTGAIQDLGLSHLFAISGMNIALIVAFLDQILKKLFIQKRAKEGIILAVLGLYCILTGFSVSVLRAVAIVFCVFIRDWEKLSLSRIDLMTFVLCFFLILNPFYLDSLGFKLSFLIAFSIVIGQTLLKTTHPFLSVLKLGIYANLIALPILLEANKEWNLLSIPANLVFVLFVEKCLFPASFLTVFLPAFARFYQLLLRLFTEAVRFLAQWDTAISFNFPSDWSKALYFVLILWLLIRLETKKAWIKPALCIVFLCLFVFTFPTLPGVSFVKILDVGQGDAIYIHAGGADVLIDTGKSDDYDALIAYFKGENIRHLDRVIITHSDADHCGELLDLLKEIDVGRVVCGAFLAGVPESRTALVKEGDKIRVNDLEFDVLSSSSGNTDENDNSLVLYGIIGFQTWLFMGDAGIAVEQRLMQDYVLSPDVLKVGHHGSDTSSSASFLFAADPEFAVISVGKNNTYGHPVASVLKQLSKIGAEVYRTDECGTLTFFYLPFFEKGMLTKNNPEKWINNEIMRFVRFL